MNYTQCHLTKNNRHKTAYIPSKFARVGNKILEEDGWIVRDVYTTMSEDNVLDQSEDYKRTRKASDA